MVTMQDQLAWERQMVDNGIERYNTGVEKMQGVHPAGTKNSIESQTTYGTGMLRYFIRDIAMQLEANIDKMKGKPGKKPIAWEYLESLDTMVTALIASRVILDNISGEISTGAVFLKIGGKIEDQARLDLFGAQDKKYMKATARYIKEIQQVEDYHRKRRIFIRAADIKAGIRPWTPWPTNDKIHIGSACVEAFIQATSDYNEDGSRILGSGLIEKYTIRTQGKGVRERSFFAGTSKTTDWIKANREVCELLRPDYMPCLIPPKPWESPTVGGFWSTELQKRKPLVKMQQKKYLNNMAGRGVDKLYTFYNAVNTIQSTAWKINREVYNQMLVEFQAPHGIGMEPSNPAPEPLAPDWVLLQRTGETLRAFQQRKREAKEDLTYDMKQEYMEYSIRVQKWHQQEVVRVAKVKSASDTILMAKTLLEYKEFYYVWTADFRSRLYPCGSALNPQGNDNHRGMLMFANGKPLGKDGFKHLCYHAAGCYGVDKVSLEDRLNWIYQNKENIIATGQDINSNRDFWGGADKPYSFLAVCLELAKCIQLSTAEQEEFISHIPCSQDGSCNGIQHYSAMLLDPVGSSAVNLVDSLEPADIYRTCADVTTKLVKFSIDNNATFTGKEWVPAKFFEMAIAKGWIEFGIDRNCTKKPTMVIPYGGTKISCRTDIRLYLLDETKKRKLNNPLYENPFVGIAIPEQDSGDMNTDSEVRATTWLHHLVWESLDEVVIAARRAMKFLQGVAGPVIKRTPDGGAISWTTPTGFRVYQEIKETTQHRIDTHLEGRLQVTLQKDIESIDKRRMRTSIAPNFVHSIDSSHLQMVINRCNLFGITDFLCIHDSIGVHAGHCTTLHKAIRETFVELHRDNLLVNFWKEQAERFPELIGELPEISDANRGNFDLDLVLTSTHFFR